MYFFQYFVGTNDMLVGLYMYRQISKCNPSDKTLKSIMGGGGGNCPPDLPPPPPPPVTLLAGNAKDADIMITVAGNLRAKRAANLKIECFYVELNALYYFHCV